MNDSSTQRILDAIGSLQNTVGSLQDSVGSLQGPVGSLQTTIGSLQDALGSLQGDVKRIDTALAELRGEVTGIIVVLRGDAMGRIDRVQDTVDRLREDSGQFRQHRPG